MTEAIEHRGKAERKTLGRFDLDHLAKATALRTGATGALAQFLAPHNDRADIFRRLDRHCMHATRKGRRVEPVERGARAGAAGIEHQDFRALAADLVAQRTHAHMQVPECTRTFRRHLSGQCLMQRAEHEVRHEMAKHVAHGNRGRTSGIEDAAFGCGNVEGRKRGGVVRNVGRHHTFNAVAGIGFRIDQRHVDAEPAHARGAVEIDQHAVGTDGQPCGKMHRLVIAVEIEAVGPAAMRQRLQPLQRRLAAVLQDEAADHRKVFEVELREHVDEAAVAGLVAGGQRMEIADHLVALAHIVAHDMDERAVQFAALEELHDRDEEAFLVNLTRIRPEAATTDIHHMGGGGKIADKPAMVEGG
ncbi:hypothetical protein DAPPUDRAFT_124580, partial [Daphnia pulex]